MARFEWTDETGLCHPSLVVVEDTAPLDSTTNPKEMPILRVKRIESFQDVAPKGVADGRLLPRIKGYRFQWQHTYMETLMGTDDPWYAFVVGYVRKEEDRNG